MLIHRKEIVKQVYIYVYIVFVLQHTCVQCVYIVIYYFFKLYNIIVYIITIYLIEININY